MQLTPLVALVISLFVPLDLDLPVAGDGDHRAAATIEAPETLPRRLPVTSGAVAFIPGESPFAPDGGFDLVFHFHGAPQTVEPLFDHSDVSAVLVTVNLGHGSSVYRQRFGAAGAFEQLVAAVEQSLASSGDRPRPRVRRIALSAWSAGFGAVAAILSDPEAQSRVDAVLLADSPHGSFADARRRIVHPGSLEPFVTFAQSAVAGERLMVITHSEIATIGYASTSESAAYIAEALALPEAPLLAALPGPMIARTHRAAGELAILGFAGDDARSHGDHLRAMDSLLLEPLRLRWSERDH